jgi:MucB/RseB N-terminal domain
MVTIKHLLITAFLVCASGASFSQTPSLTALSAAEVMAKVFANDSMREAMGGGYKGKREYVLENHRMDKRAEMEVTVSCDADGSKHFEVVSEDGWKSAHKHVLHQMLESEAETSRPHSRPKTRLVPDNYEFNLLGSDQIDGRPAYVIEALPKRSDKYLFRGRVWVDAQDYAIARVEGEPAKNPSFWIHSTHFVARYQKNGAFWFPASTTSVTDARIFGTTAVNIRYFDYMPAAACPQQQSSSSPLEAHYVRH